MADAGRESVSDKIKAAFKPDSEKTNKEHFQDAAVGKTDNLAARAEPDQDKSFLQRVSDKVTGKK